MTDERDTALRRIHAAIQAEDGIALEGEPEQDAPGGGVLVGWVLVAEWMGTDGERWLSRLAMDLPSWQVRGYLNEALHHWEDD